MPLHWPHPSALVAYNGGTNVGHGPVRTLFLSLILFPCRQTDVGRGSVTTLFLGLILFLVPMTPHDRYYVILAETQLIGGHTEY